MAASEAAANRLSKMLMIQNVRSASGLKEMMVFSMPSRNSISTRIVSCVNIIQSPSAVSALSSTTLMVCSPASNFCAVFKKVRVLW